MEKFIKRTKDAQKGASSTTATTTAKPAAAAAAAATRKKRTPSGRAARTVSRGSRGLKPEDTDTKKIKVENAAAGNGIARIIPKRKEESSLFMRISSDEDVEKSESESSDEEEQPPIKKAKKSRGPRITVTNKSRVFKRENTPMDRDETEGNEERD